MARADLPSGLVTFLFTDIVGSTRLIQELGEEYRPMLMEYRRVLRRALPPGAGIEVSVEGDGGFFAFTDATAALVWCACAQRGFAGDGWPNTVPRPSVRIGLHTGVAAPVDGEYVSVEVHRAARVAAAARGGQVLCTAVTARQARVPIEGALLADLGLCRLRDLQRPERLFELVVPRPAVMRATVKQPAPLGPLTRTESVVARLVAEGLSNPQIAQRLCISRHTVETHLKHVFAKLAVSSRGELTVMILRNPMAVDLVVKIPKLRDVRGPDTPAPVDAISGATATR